MMPHSVTTMPGLELEMSLVYGVVALARPTFDVPFAEETMHNAFAALDAAGIQTVGPRTLAFDEAATVQSLEEIESAEHIDLLLIMQITFTDASMAIKIAKRSQAPVAIWAFPEPRLGGRLRLNAYCGLNLAAHALGKAGIAHGWLFAATDAPHLNQSLLGLAQPVQSARSLAVFSKASKNTEADRIVQSLKQARISIIGEHPQGFDTCEYDASALKTLAGIEVTNTDMQALFDTAKGVAQQRVKAVRTEVEASLSGLSEVNQEQLERSLRLFCALQDLQQKNDATSMAVRCWPETFTEYGCAACGPMAMMNQNKIPCACEADVYGSLSALIMQELAGEPAWMADLVDLDMEEDSAVFWHCGLAPLSMCAPDFEPEATIHTNRKMPLLHQFPLKPGRMTLARISQSRNETKMIIAGAEVLQAPMAFTGTSGVFRFDKNSKDVCRTIIEQGLEHHYAMAYGEHRNTLKEIAARLALPILELT